MTDQEQYLLTASAKYGTLRPRTRHHVARMEALVARGLLDTGEGPVEGDDREGRYWIINDAGRTALTEGGCLMDLLTTTTAEFSDDRAYRYWLTRTWDDRLPRCAFVMLNPSTADEFKNDPTVTRCIGFAKEQGCGALSVSNIFAYRATDPKDMRAAPDPIGPENDEAIIKAMEWVGDGPVICAWGVHGAFRGRGDAVRRLLVRQGVKPLALLLTLRGHPSHPLYLAATTNPIPFTGAEK
jgi:hypothetical protein